MSRADEVVDADIAVTGTGTQSRSTSTGAHCCVRDRLVLREGAQLGHARHATREVGKGIRLHLPDLLTGEEETPATRPSLVKPSQLRNVAGSMTHRLRRNGFDIQLHLHLQRLTPTTSTGMRIAYARIPTCRICTPADAIEASARRTGPATRPCRPG
jgi:hypothetical protein